jgi:hypothetical protein
MGILAANEAIACRMRHAWRLRAIARCGPRGLTDMCENSYNGGASLIIHRLHCGELFTNQWALAAGN